MKRAQTFVAQAGSARRVVAEAGIKHDDRAQGELTVGVTPAVAGESVRGQTLHFCSALLHDVRILQHGDGKPLPVDNYPVVVDGGTPEVDAPGLLRFRADIHPNGALTLSQRNRRARYVRTPESLLETIPHAHEWGPMDIAEAYGCSSVQELFDVHSEEVLVS